MDFLSCILKEKSINWTKSNRT